MPEPTIIDKCKMALRVTTDEYDAEINEYIEAAEKDLGIAGVTYSSQDALITRAIMTFVRMNFGAPKNYNQLKAAYDEQKAQLQTATGYTDWGDA